MKTTSSSDTDPLLRKKAPLKFDPFSYYSLAVAVAVLALANIALANVPETNKVKMAAVAADTPEFSERGNALCLPSGAAITPFHVTDTERSCMCCYEAGNHVSKESGLGVLDPASSGEAIPSSHVTDVPEMIKVKNAAVAADTPECSEVGNKVLKEGGNAVDAAVATAFCLGVLSPASSGIGGGNFMIVRMASGTAKAFNMRETAPLEATPNMFHDSLTAKKRGIRSACTPGEVKGLYEAWDMFGKLRWRWLVKPAEDYARNGFNISKNLYRELTKVKTYILKDTGLRQIYGINKTHLKVAGTLVKNVKLADTLHAIAEKGPDALYKGQIGDDLIKDIDEANEDDKIVLTKKDLVEYTVNVTEPLELGEFMGMKLLGMPPPSTGGVGMMLLLNILSEYGTDIKSLSDRVGLHRFIEALKHMFAVRSHVGDPKFVQDTQKVVDDMLSREFAATLKKDIDDTTTLESIKHYGGEYKPKFQNLSIIDDHGTSHVSVVDSERNAVALTCTLNNYFGSLFLSKRTGILLNNEMDDFAIPLDTGDTSGPTDIDAAEANYIRPGKRPISSMSPTIVLENGQLKGVFGGSGGATIIAGTTQVFLHYFLGKLDPYQSMMKPRLYHTLIPNEVRYENTKSAADIPVHILTDTNLREGLQQTKHNVTETNFANKCQIIIHDIELGELTAVSDPRNMGLPAGH